MIEGDQAVGEDEGGIGQGGLMRGIAAALGLQLITEVTGETAIELEGQAAGRHAQALRLCGEVVEDRLPAQLTLTPTLDPHLALADVVGDGPSQRTAVVAHEGKASARVHPATVKPERALTFPIQADESQLGVNRVLEPFHLQLRRGSDGDTPGRADTQSGRPPSPRTQALNWSRPRVRAGVSPSLPPPTTQITKVLEQPPPVLCADRLGVELDAPEGAVAVFERHQHPIARPGDPAQVGRQRLLYAERVIADGLELTGDAGEQRRVVVEDRAEATVDGFRRGDDLRAVKPTQALMPQTDTQYRHG